MPVFVKYFSAVRIRAGKDQQVSGGECFATGASLSSQTCSLFPCLRTGFQHYRVLSKCLKVGHLLG